MSQLTHTPASVTLSQQLRLAKPMPAELIVFAACLEALFVVCKPPLSERQIEVYFGLLSDLQPVAVQAAAADIASSREYSTWPMPGEIRAKALELASPVPLDWGQAFRLAILAVRDLIDAQHGYLVVRAGVSVEVSEWNQRTWDRLPPIAAEALRQFGWRSLREDANCRAQFRDIYNGLAAREQAERARLPAVRRLVQQQARRISDALNGNAIEHNANNA